MGHNSTVKKLLAGRQLAIANRLTARRAVLPSGLPPLDSFLPYHGFDIGGITEFVGVGAKQRIAGLVLAWHSRTMRVAYLAADGLLNPRLFTAAGGHLSNAWFLVESNPRLLAWSAQQVMASGIFSLVVFYGSRFNDGAPLLTPLLYRRLLGLTKKHQLTTLLLLDEHPALASMGRPCALRLQFTREKIRILKCARAEPGRELTLPGMGGGAK